MKTIFLVYFDVFNSKYLGVKKKIFWQLKAMNECGLEPVLAYRSDNKLIIIDSNEKVIGEYHFSNIWYREGVFLKLREHIIENSEYKTIYIRLPGLVDFSFYRTLKMLSNQGLKIFIEMPTYPIGGEIIAYYKQLLNNKKIFSLLVKTVGGGVHRFLSRRIKKYITNIVTFMPYNKIWGTDVIEIDNGVSLKDIRLREKEFKKDKTEFVLLGVANVDKWHGYDRMINGIADYYSDKSNLEKKQIVFKIAGEGPEILNLKKLTNELGLNQNVIFLGMQDGHELDVLFREADVAVSSLGMHRIGVTSGSTLKTKEYCARGIPFIYAYTEKKIENSWEYAMKIDAYDKPVVIKDLLSFYERVSQDKDYIFKMREFAIENFTWESQMQLVAAKIIERN